jgi:DNA polymerase-4
MLPVQDLLSPVAEDPRWQDAAGLRWLFVDLNSFFASVEQQLRPELRGLPVIVRPAASEYTCAIAASHEARLLGIRTGTRVAEARTLSAAHGRTLQVVEARPDIYVETHKKVMAALERCLPIDRICSIDEAACRLSGPQRLQANAVELARRVQLEILTVGECLGSSVGLAPSRLLAKLACGMRKPRGLTVLRADELPAALLDLPLSRVPGIGPRMQTRLEAAGVSDMAGFWALGPRKARRLWNTIEGERLWRGLQGEDVEPPGEAPLASMSHGHILAGSARDPQTARAIARRLTVKCGARLRRLDTLGSSLNLMVDLCEGSPGRGRAGQGADRSSRRACRIGGERRFSPTQDTFVLLRALDSLWLDLADALAGQRIRQVRIGIDELGPQAGAGPDLFGWSPGVDANPRTLALSRALDTLNARFGKDTIVIGPRVEGTHYMGAKIVFNRIPDVAEFRE